MTRAPTTRAPTTRALATPLSGPPPEAEVARDLTRRALLVAPALAGACALVWGVEGALSSVFALALVVANFRLAAALMAWAAPISVAVLAAAVLGGYLARLGLLAGAIWAVRGAGWVEMVPLGVTLVVGHLGLLVWESRSVSLSFAFPGLKPKG
ncbi:MAG: ATP synthase subunit I [Acidimicrobiales bacterium]